MPSLLSGAVWKKAIVSIASGALPMGNASRRLALPQSGRDARGPRGGGCHTRKGILWRGVVGVMRPYVDADFLRIRDFLVATYSHFQRSYNWTIERWNFSISLARSMHAVSMEVWASQIAIWEQDGEIVAVARRGRERRRGVLPVGPRTPSGAAVAGAFRFLRGADGQGGGRSATHPALPPRRRRATGGAGGGPRLCAPIAGRSR